MQAGNLPGTKKLTHKAEAKHNTGCNFLQHLLRCGKNFLNRFLLSDKVLFCTHTHTHRGSRGGWQANIVKNVYRIVQHPFDLLGQNSVRVTEIDFRLCSSLTIV